MDWTLETLLAHVEALTGPDRETDAAIDSLTYRGPIEDRLCGCTGDCLPGHPSYTGACVCVPNYTKSLSEAAALLRQRIADALEKDEEPKG